jgi:hypothetical protein
MPNHSTLVWGLVAATLGMAGGCGGDDDEDAARTGSPEQTGSACEAPADCYPNVDHDAIRGDIQCLDRVRYGYCTHLCETDDDCCAAEGECETDLRQVCSPFESTGQRMCFLSCESRDLRAAADAADSSEPVNEQEYCQREASTDFICRSSGGGAQNRKICVPGNCGVGAACADDRDCDPALACLTDFRGGYCGKANCTGNADCPGNAQCVRVGDDETTCMRSCADDTDCSFCRGSEVAATCSDDVERVEAGGGRVCVPSR